MTAAAMESPTSRPPTFFAAGAGAGVGRGAGAGAVVAAGAVAPAGRAVPVELGGRDVVSAGAVVGGRGGAGAAAEGAAGAGVAEGTETLGAAGAGTPPAGMVGNLIVGADVGFGGRLMRTVSFLVCALGASAGLGGTPPGPAGMFGVFSAIELVSATKLGLPSHGVKPELISRGGTASSRRRMLPGGFADGIV